MNQQDQSRKRNEVPDDTQLAAEEGSHHLSQMNTRISQFLAAAQNEAPARSIEDDDGNSDTAIQMNLVLGVLEQQEPLPNRDGIILPTPGAAAQLDERDESQAQAMLGLLRALAGTPDSDESSVAIDNVSDSDDDGPIRDG